MKIKTVICDIDATLMRGGGGVVLNDVIQQAMIELQEHGITIILNSARVFCGIWPIAKQIKMDHYGGYILSCNGAAAYECKSGTLLFQHAIAKEHALAMKRCAAHHGLAFAISQSDVVLADAFPRGFSLDHTGCDVDYVISTHMERLIKDPIEKCSAAADPKTIEKAFPAFRHELEQSFPCAVVQSTPYIIDITAWGCDKVKGCEELAQLTSFSFAEAAAIGDSDSDAGMLAQSAFSATLANGTPLCKHHADIIVDHVENNGCITFFQTLLSRSRDK